MITDDIVWVPLWTTCGNKFRDVFEQTSILGSHKAYGGSALTGLFAGGRYATQR